MVTLYSKQKKGYGKKKLLKILIKGKMDFCSIDYINIKPKGKDIDYIVMLKLFADDNHIGTISFNLYRYDNQNIFLRHPFHCKILKSPVKIYGQLCCNSNGVRSIDVNFNGSTELDYCIHYFRDKKTC